MDVLSDTNDPEIEDGDSGGKGDEDDHNDGKKRASTGSSSPPASTREKRARKSTTTQVYKPEDFSQVDHSPQLVDGKGTTLADIPKVKETIENLKDNSEELVLAYRFLFSVRARVKPKEIKDNLLKFNGYLATPPVDADETDVAKAEEAVEKKYSIKAYKLHVKQLKKLCDVFAVDRSGMTDKDSLVETLLDFLSQPDEKLTKGGKKKPVKNKSTSSKSKTSTVDPFSDEEEIVEGEIPSEKQLRHWVRAYVRCFNTSKKTLKDAMQIAEEKFGVDLSDKKQRIKELLTEEL